MSVRDQRHPSCSDSRGETALVLGLAKAELLGIAALTLGQASRTDWKGALHAVSHLRVVSFMLPMLEAVKITLPASVTPPDPAAISHAVLIGTNDHERPLRDVVEGWLRDDAFVRKLEEIAFSTGDTVVEPERSLKQGTRLRLQTGETLPAVAIWFRARCRKVEHPVQTGAHTYRDTEVAVASANVFGRELQIVGVNRGEDQVVNFRLRVKPRPTPKKVPKRTKR